ncbi:MAG: uL30 family ribosomal protein [archaeon]
MITVIRIIGEVGIDRDIRETLHRLRLRKKYSCVVIPNVSKQQEGMIKKLKDCVAYGEIDKELFEKLIEKRGKQIDRKKKIDIKKITEELLKGKKYEELNIKPFFRLHPARGGINSKKHFGKEKGVLGNHGKEINKLLERML